MPTESSRTGGRDVSNAEENEIQSETLPISRWSGTSTVIVPSEVRRCITIWLPLRRTSVKW